MGKRSYIKNTVQSMNNNDEYYTPAIFVEPIIKHFDIWKRKFIKENNRLPIVLAPFDTENSEYVIALKKYNNHILKFGHISTGQDFFTYVYGDYDIVISNMPFSLKTNIMIKPCEEKKSFALVCSLMSLNHLSIANIFAKYHLQLLGFNRHISYNGKPSAFTSGYFCSNFLERDLIFENLEHNNTGKMFTPSRMYEDNQ
jgi:hypothetical protein